MTRLVCGRVPPERFHPSNELERTMPVLTPDEAHEAVEALPYSAGRLKTRGTGHMQYAYLHYLKAPDSRDIAISRRATQNGVTVYVNRFSGAGEEFPVDSCADVFPGVSVSEQYPKGYRGSTGDVGLASSAKRCPTLVPADYPVLRLSCSDLDGFTKLVRWYAGKERLAPSAASATDGTAVLANELPVARLAAVEPSTVAPAATVPTEVQPPVGELVDDAGRLTDPAKRAAVERRAVELAIAYYRERGFVVTERGKPFDLLCTPTSRCPPGTPLVHVEVKGSVSATTTVHLTRNEIADARQDTKTWRSDLFLVREIRLLPMAPGTWRGTAGVPALFEDWCPLDEDLVPTDFVYRLPAMPHSEK